MIWLMGVMTAVNVATLLLVWWLADGASKDSRRAAECSEEAKLHAGDAALSQAGAEASETRASAVLATAEELERDRTDPAPAMSAVSPAGGHDGKYGQIETTGKQLHTGEPAFLLRATDPFAPHAIRMYANYCGMHGAGIDHVKECHAGAGRIEEWQKENPALVKKLPD